MDFRIADTFTESLARLTADEQKAAKTAAFDLQLNPAHPGLQFHKLDKAKDHNFWSVRVTLDIRMIVHRTQASLLLCYVAHHDDAYHWGERRKLETHPKTGAAQLVELREMVQEIFVPKYIEVARPRPLPFAHIPDSELLGYGVPPAWIEEVKAADEDSILTIAGHLPSEAAEAVLDIAVGVKPKPAVRLPAGADPFAHPDAQRRFRSMGNHDELAAALDFPWEKWTIFLHPDQRTLVERDYAGPARVAGSAGTGKTIVGLHRAAHLARQNRTSRILLTTFSQTLANALESKLRCLLASEPRLAENIQVFALQAIAQRLYKANLGKPVLAADGDIDQAIAESVKAMGGTKYSAHFLRTEWEHVVDAWNLTTWESYRDVSRLGRKTRLPEAQRLILWSVFEKVWAGLHSRGLITVSEMFAQLAAHYESTGNPPFDYVIVDEAQDVSVAQLKFLAAMASGRANGLFFAGDLGQRIFQQPFSWKALGVDVRGRSATLKINYRTSHQIRQQADRLLGPEVTDIDGNKEERKGTISVFNGAPPGIRVLKLQAEEIAMVGAWLKSRMAEGARPHEIGIFVRSERQLDRAKAASEQAGVDYRILDEHVQTQTGHVSVCTMHLAKGLEFKTVAVMACDDTVIPLQQRIETVVEASDLEEVYNTERHLLYVACTRARDHLWVSGASPASEFLDDLGVKSL
jgi:mRNA-degrading endonuclease RelE of RelBE toxin-antitoxin system